ncbi:MAG: alpha-glucan family phosphorylase [Candidatus Woesearchaeota archaeon]
MADLEKLVKNAKVVYYSMEYGFKPSVRVYSGGLGILSGDTMKSAADLEIPLIGIGLLYQDGYFQQDISDGIQQEYYDSFDPKWLMSEVKLKHPLHVKIEGRTVNLKAWAYEVKGNTGHTIPVFFLDTFHNEHDADRKICNTLYGGDRRHRCKQEVVLGIGGTKLVHMLGATPDTYHLNEGHGAFVGVELIKRFGLEEAKNKIVFTTHTPVPAGHDWFSYNEAFGIIQEDMPHNIKDLAGHDKLNMTTLALNTSRYANAVAKLHGEVAKGMHDGHEIDYITNGVHSYTWTAPAMRNLFNRIKPNWQPEDLDEIAKKVQSEDLLAAHMLVKERLIEYANQYNETGAELTPEKPVFGFARRMAEYKRATLIFDDIERLIDISNGNLQLIFAGKAHPHDQPAKRLIAEIFNHAKDLRGKVEIAFIPDYDMHIGELMTAGSDVWLNTPMPPQEASGTSGMKSAHNAVPTASFIDGWWYEAQPKGGWSIGVEPQTRDLVQTDNKTDAQMLYDVVQNEILPAISSVDPYVIKMREALSNAAFFNTHRMVRDYAKKAYHLKLKAKQ